MDTCETIPPVNHENPISSRASFKATIRQKIQTDWFFHFKGKWGMLAILFGNIIFIWAHVFIAGGDPFICRRNDLFFGAKSDQNSLVQMLSSRKDSRLPLAVAYWDGLLTLTKRHWRHKSWITHSWSIFGISVEMAMTTFVTQMAGEQRRPGALVKHAFILSLLFCYASSLPHHHDQRNISILITSIMTITTVMIVTVIIVIMTIMIRMMIIVIAITSIIQTCVAFLHLLGACGVSARWWCHS